MIMPVPIAPRIYAQGAAGPTSRATSSGRPNIPLAMMQLRTSAVSVQRPSTRTSFGFDSAAVAAGVSTGTFRVGVDIAQRTFSEIFASAKRNQSEIKEEAILARRIFPL